MNAYDDFRISTKADGQTRVAHRATCKRIPANNVAVTELTAGEKVVQASCCKPKFADVKALEESLVAPAPVVEEAPVKPAKAKKPVAPAEVLEQVESAKFGYTVKLDDTKMPRYRWEVVGTVFAQLLAKHSGTAALIDNKAFTVRFIGDDLDACTAAGDLLHQLWVQGVEELATLRKTPEYKALGKKGPKWYLSAKYAAEQAHLRTYAEGILAGAEDVD